MSPLIADELASLHADSAADLLRERGLEVTIQEAWGANDEGVLVLQAVLRIGATIERDARRDGPSMEQLLLDLAA